MRENLSVNVLNETFLIQDKFYFFSYSYTFLFIKDLIIVLEYAFNKNIKISICFVDHYSFLKAKIVESIVKLISWYVFFFFKWLWSLIFRWLYWFNHYSFIKDINKQIKRKPTTNKVLLMIEFIKIYF